MIPFFATGHLLGEPPEAIRQAVVLYRVGDYYRALGEGGTEYLFDRVRWVPLKNLWGSTKEFAVAAGVRD